MSKKIKELKKENTELKKQIENIKYLDRDGIERYLRLKFSYRYELETIENRDIGEAVKHICNLALPTKEKIIRVLKDYYFEDEEDIKLFKKIASEILGDDNENK